MRTKSILLNILSVVLLGLSFTVHADSSMTTGTLVQLCNNETGKLICIGYISGVTDTIVLMNDMRKQESLKPIICPPSSGISNDLAMRIVLRYITLNPELLSHNAREVVVIALISAFKC